MREKETSAAPLVEPSTSLRCDNGGVSEWRTNIELPFEADDDEARREYTNIGGQNGLELFV